ncbi:MAG: hypothetical protein K0S05_3078 [Agromyces sp.]|jgi:hypothetical protein|nr:hypothetical protein [Agromyces sp.]
MTDVHAAPAGWYPEPDGTEGQRWWDGTRWTEYSTPLAAPPYVAYGTERPAVPAGTATDTLWVWLVAVLPILPFIPFFFVDFSGYMLRSMTDPTAQLAMYLDPMYLATTLLGWVAYGVSVWFAYLDTKELRRLGYSRPFHWAWTFLWSLVYVIGRTVVVRRQAGRGSAPMAVAIVVNVAIVIGTFIWVGVLFADLMNATMTTYPGV